MYDKFAHPPCEELENKPIGVDSKGHNKDYEKHGYWFKHFP